MVDLSEVRSSHRHVVHEHPNDLSQHAILTIEGGVPARGNNYFNVSIDMSMIDNQTTFRVQRKVNGAYGIEKVTIYPDDYPAEVELVNFELEGQGGDMRITMQSTVAEGPTNVDITFVEVYR